MFGVSFDTKEENNAFACKFSFPFPLLCDTTRAMGLAYGAADSADAGYPKRISYLIGPNGDILVAYEKVDPTGHPDQVIADLDRLAAP